MCVQLLEPGPLPSSFEPTLWTGCGGAGLHAAQLADP